jgi:hypothetical protein
VVLTIFRRELNFVESLSREARSPRQRRHRGDGFNSDAVASVEHR